MIEIRYAPTGVDVSVSLGDLAFLHDRIQEFLIAESEEYLMEADTLISPWPCERALKRLILRKGVGPTRVSVIGDDLTVEGGAEYLEVFSSYLNFPSDTTHGCHSHYEYFEGNRWIAPDSVPLVLGVRDPQQSR